MFRRTTHACFVETVSDMAVLAPQGLGRLFGKTGDTCCRWIDGHARRCDGLSREREHTDVQMKAILSVLKN